MSQMTKLEAVNQLLDAIGEDPVSSLASGLDDAETAERYLDRISKTVQSKAWHTNTDKNTTLVPTAGSRIELANNTLRVDTVGVSKHINVVPRKEATTDVQLKLWDIKNNTFVITETLYADITYFYPFESLPFPLQNHIATLAAERFQQGELGSITIDHFTTRETAQSWADLLAWESEGKDGNVLLDNLSSRNITRRPNRWWGIR